MEPSEFYARLNKAKPSGPTDASVYLPPGPFKIASWDLRKIHMGALNLPRHKGEGWRSENNFKPR
ncbi:hypothetical protein KL86PLE_40870 [uncultured Pleomorphomonas sp.]|uniref:Uncharacterized protein n=1 Tax=uncultured Pleomorphomonas sp. TaxID=442121 RepID=A0A212LHP2_9HYPH|nr:hypothetical protein KL86PLE_40870 [uncultured Pleomorphomonas sp.]